MERRSWGVKGADLGSGLGPCAVHDNFRAEDGYARDPAPTAGGSNSRYADPEADGVKPVLRTISMRLVSAGSVVINLDYFTNLSNLVRLSSA